MGFLKGAATLLREASGANLERCPGKTAPGIKCKKKVRPGYGGCGDPKCTTTFGEAI